MLINKRKLVELVASTDYTRSRLTQPHLDIENKVLVATNGRAMAVVGVTIEPRDVAGPVPLVALKEARKVIAKDGIAHLDCRKLVVLVNRMVFPRYGSPYGPPSGTSFPTWQEVTKRPPGSPIIVSFDHRLLTKVARSLGITGQVILEVTPNPDTKTSTLEAMRVYDVGSADNDYAIMMPCRSERRY